MTCLRDNSAKFLRKLVNAVADVFRKVLLAKGFSSFFIHF